MDASESGRVGRMGGLGTMGEIEQGNDANACCESLGKKIVEGVPLELCAQWRRALKQNQTGFA